MKKLITAALAPIIAFTFGTNVIAAEPAADMMAEPAKSTAKAKLVDINTATETQLTAILGVGSEDARRIIDARPYAKKDDLNTKKVIPSDVYEKIKKLIDAVC